MSRPLTLPRLALGMVLCLAALGEPALTQTFNSGSTGSDGALNLSGTPAGTTVQFDPASFSPSLDPDGDNVYHFTTITIPAGVTVRLSADRLGVSPVVWLATGPVRIDGVLNLRGSRGHNIGETVLPAIAGAGGYAGGPGATASSPPRRGEGLGASVVAPGSAGHAVAGFGVFGQPGGPAYGNDFLLPLLGGSGGTGGEREGVSGAGGGAGGGALLIASTSTITIDGDVWADGGEGGCGGNFTVASVAAAAAARSDSWHGSSRERGRSALKVGGCGMRR